MKDFNPKGVLNVSILKPYRTVHFSQKILKSYRLRFLNVSILESYRLGVCSRTALSSGCP